MALVLELPPHVRVVTPDEEANLLHIDPKTQLLEGAALPIALNREIMWAQQYRHFAGVACADLASFKAINETEGLGAPIADRVLRAAARTLAGMGLLAFRLYGDDLAIIPEMVTQGPEEAYAQMQATLEPMFSYRIQEELPPERARELRAKVPKLAIVIGEIALWRPEITADELIIDAKEKLRVAKVRHKDEFGYIR